LTVTQFAIAVLGVPPVMIQLSNPVPTAQYDTLLPGQMIVSPVNTGAKGGATTVTLYFTESLQT
jgi:hypothetical protein